MKISYIKSALFAFAAVGMLASCSNDSDSNEPNIQEKFEGIYLNIPMEHLATRATPVNPTETEGKINKLTVVPFLKGTGDTYTMQTPIEETTFVNGFNPGVITSYQPVPIKLAPGTYKLYVFANLELSDIKVDNNVLSTSNSEDDLLSKAVLTLSPVNTPGTKGLPMSCPHSLLKVNDAAVGTNPITIGKGEAKSVKADLTLCVSKLRVTVLNGTTPDLKMNASEPTTLSNYLSTVGLYTAPTDQTPTTTATDLSGGKYYDFPTQENSTDLVDPKTWTVTDLTDSKDTAPAKFAWQGVWYVPEHLFASNVSGNTNYSTVNVQFNYPDSDQHTLINAESNTDNVDYTTATGVVRSNFYDHLYYISAKKVTVRVMVKPWKYHKYNYDLE